MTRQHDEMTVPELVETVQEALTIGKMMRDPEKWADVATRRGMLAHAFMIVGTLLEAFHVSVPVLGNTDATDLAGGISVLVGLFLSYRSQKLHRASNPYAG